MKRIIEITEEKCNGCGLCVQACHEGAIGLVDGKAKLLREDYCDGLGDCLPSCPQGAISFLEKKETRRSFGIRNNTTDINWPCQLKLVPYNASFLNNKALVLVASCVPLVYPKMHDDFLNDKAYLVACPKLEADYSAKLKAIFDFNNIKELTILKMDVPCCNGLVKMVDKALGLAIEKTNIAIRIVTFNKIGKIL